MEIKTVKVSSEISKKFKNPVPEMVLDLFGIHFGLLLD